MITRKSGARPTIVAESGQFGDVPSSRIALTLFGDPPFEIVLCRAHELVQSILESIIGLECMLHLPPLRKILLREVST
jgi:hypothetical protein